MVLDPWNHPYVYRDPSSRSGHDYDLCSLGESAIRRLAYCWVRQSRKLGLLPLAGKNCRTPKVPRLLRRRHDGACRPSRSRQRHDPMDIRIPQRFGRSAVATLEHVDAPGNGVRRRQHADFFSVGDEPNCSHFHSTTNVKERTPQLISVAPPWQKFPRSRSPRALGYCARWRV